MRRDTPVRSELPEMDPHLRIGIVASSFYQEEIEGLIAGAKSVLEGAGLSEDNVTVYRAPGSFEIPLIGRAVLDAEQADALIAFGIIVQGDTKHADLLAAETARGIMDIQTAYGVPFAFEVLYVQDLKQARERCLGPGNKGEEAAHAVLHSLAELKRIRSGGH